VNVFVITWTHKYGTDMWVASTREVAKKTLATELLEAAVGELGDEVDKKFKDYYRVGLYSNAIEVYFDAMRELETYEINERRVVDR
jgi:hypothetical protein